MQEKTLELIKKFEQDNEIYLSATDAQTYWIVYARVTKEDAGPEGPHNLHRGVKYVSGPNEDGNVLVMRDPFISNAYSVESWGPMGTINDFVKKAFAHILDDKAVAEKGQEGGCGTSCG